MNFLKAISVFLGTVIGAGIFGLPFVAMRAGFFVVVFYFVFMVLITLSINLLYAEVVVGTKEFCRLPGYAGEYLGKKWKKITFFIIGLGLIGALLAYLIIGGEFLSSFFGPYLGGGSLFYTLLFFIFGSYLVFRDIKSIAGVELFLLFAFLIILAVFFIKAFPVINIEYLRTINLKFFTFPYGVILFALWGSSIIPEIKEILAPSAADKSRQEWTILEKLRKVIFWGVVFSAIIYLLFIFIVLGASGPKTSEEAISGLAKVLTSNVVKLGFVFGVITCFTSFLAIALTLKKTLWYDFGLPKNFAWFVACFLPLTIFLLGVRKFIEVISVTGAIALGIEGIIIVFLYKEFLKKKFSQKLNPVFYLLVGVFVLGIIFEIIYFPIS